MTDAFLPPRPAKRGEGWGEGHRPLPALLFAVAVAFLAAPACTRSINLLPPRADGAVGGDTGTVNPACTDPGDPILLPTATGPICAATLATRGHRYALCSCDNMNAPARVRTDSFDSRTTAVFAESGAAIGVNGGLTAAGEVRAGGALTVAGTAGIDASGQLRAAATLRVGGPLTIRDDNADFDGDAYINGNVTATGSGRVRVNGTLHVPAGAVLTGVETGTTVNEPVSVPSPCDCGAAFVDIAGAVAAAATSNADAAIGLAPAALADAIAPMTIDLPCGTFYLDDVDAEAPVVFNVHGRTLLAVGGDVTTRAGLTVQLDPSAELDLLVAGQLIVSGGGTFGAPGLPARFRVWVAGATTALFDGSPAISAVIHAPAAPVSAPGGLPLSGSLLARSVAIGADSDLHFDRAIFESGAICNEPAAVAVP